MRGILLIFFSTAFLFSTAQKISLDRFKNLKARNIGPASMSGRVTAIDAVVANPNIIYLGTASGGVWKTDNAGSSWSSVFDEQPMLNIGSVAIQQSNPSVVWVGTGEGNPRNSLNIGAGIYKSMDDGKTWKMMGLEKTRNIHRIIIDPANPDVVYAAAIGNPFAEHPERGVYKTTDGGETWKLILHTNDTSGCADLVMDPSNPNKLLANMWQHRRTPYSFKSGGPGSGFYITYDGGKNWTKLGKKEGLPEGDYGRIGIAIAPSDPKRIYAMVEAKKNGLYRTDDGGAKWELVNSNASDVTNRPFYFQDIRVDPKNENRVYNVYQMISLSEDGGKNFKVIVPYQGIHPDHHAFWIHPNDPNLIIDGNDGGIGISRDRGKTWKFDEQLPLGQFYHINTDNELPYNIMGGMQDNGSWRGPAYTWIDAGIRNYFWQSLWGGDGFDVSPDPENSNWIYAMSQGGNLGKYNVQTGEQMNLRPPVPDLKTRLRFNWNAAFAQDPHRAGTIYYGSQFVHKSDNKGLNWEIISPDLTTNDSLQQKQDENGGLSVDITGAENFNTIMCIEPSPTDQGVLWVGTDDGNVQLTRDGGKTWTNFRGKIPGMPLGAWIPQIRAGRSNAGEAFIVCNDYRRGDFAPYIFRTKDFGKTWERMIDDKKVQGYALCMIQDPVTPNLIFVGTEQGLWVSFDDGNAFEQWKHGYPSVSTYDLAIQEREADLCIGSYGRAIYVLDDIRPLRAMAATKGIPTSKTLTVFEAPVAYQVSSRNVSGYDYSSWGVYEGQNRPRGAAFSFFLNKKPIVKSTETKNKTNTVEKTNDTAKSKKTTQDSVYVNIYNDANELIRTRRIKADTGFNRAYWSFEMKGNRQPGSAKPKPGDEEPWGMAVFPGVYKLVISLGNERDSTMLTVKPDPAVTPQRDVYDAKQAAMKRINTSTDKLVAITDRFAEAEETIAKVEAALKNVETPEADSLRKTGKAMTDSIKSIRHFIFGKPQEKQGYGSPYQLTVNGKLWEARTGVTGKEKKPDAQEFAMIADAESLVAEAVKKTNDFFNGKWKQYQQQVDATPVKLFKEYQPLN
jgi:photosystem II stability/assembly factor-like uncharacterized protein